MFIQLRTRNCIVLICVLLLTACASAPKKAIPDPSEFTELKENVSRAKSLAECSENKVRSYWSKLSWALDTEGSKFGTYPDPVTQYPMLAKVGELRDYYGEKSVNGSYRFGCAYIYTSKEKSMFSHKQCGQTKDGYFDGWVSVEEPGKVSFHEFHNGKKNGPAISCNCRGSNCADLVGCSQQWYSEGSLSEDGKRIYTVPEKSSISDRSPEAMAACKAGEYAYLAPFVEKDAQWGNSEWHNFVENLSDKHLGNLAVDWGLTQDTSLCGVTNPTGSAKQVEVTNSSFFLENLGGRHDVVDKLQSEIYKVSHWLPQKLNPSQDGSVNWHETVKWACDKSINNSPACMSGSTYDIEKIIIISRFPQGWDKLTPAQRRLKVQKDNDVEKDERKKIICMGKSARVALLIQQSSPVIVQPIAMLAGPTGWAVGGIISGVTMLIALKPEIEKLNRMIYSLHSLKEHAIKDFKN